MGNNQKMKLYYSPLSIAAILLSTLGVSMLISMLMGAYPTYLSFILIVVGSLLLWIDSFIRKSKRSAKSKLLIQLLGIVLILIIGYLLV